MVLVVEMQRRRAGLDCKEAAGVRARWVGGDVPSLVQSCLVTVDYRYVTKCFDFISFSAAFLDTPKEPSGDGTCLVFGLSPKSPAARLVCGERPGGESCHTVLALSGPRPSGVRPGPDVTRRGVSAGPEVWVKSSRRSGLFQVPPLTLLRTANVPRLDSTMRYFHGRGQRRAQFSPSIGVSSANRLWVRAGRRARDRVPVVSE